ncbi:MAG: TrbI/VirB10 family protein [Micavibrio sp.]|nr:TrbI/VirB10 family protein [Micavibrio sp.]
MTNNENEHDVDIDAQEDFDKEPVQKASLKDTWDSNPLLKIAAVVVVVALLGGGYVAFFSDKGESTNISTIKSATSTGIKADGNASADAEYQAKIKQQNDEAAKNAAKTGASNMPIVLGNSQQDKLDVPPVQAQPQGDPLQEWRAKAEARRLTLEEQAPPPEESEMPAADVPVVQPIRPQQTVKMDPAAAKQLTEQMRAIIGTQVPKTASRMKVTNRTSAYGLKLRADADKAKQATAAGVTGTATTNANGTTSKVDAQGNPIAAEKKTIVPAGNIAYAQLLNDINSDVQGPALAQILSGPFEGGRAIGDFARQDEYVTLNFRRIVKDGVSYSINGIALDEKTTLAANQTDVNHHYFQRIILPAAAQFLTGYTQAAATVEQQQSTSSGGVATDIPAPDAKQQVMAGATQAAQSISNVLTQDQNRPVTVYVKRGTTMGILFMDPVTTASAEQ